jgi:two-component system response regulator FixJ
MAPIYIVDDDTGFRTGLAALFNSIDLKYHAFTSAEDFLEACCAELEPGVVLLDVRMGGMDGLSMQAELNRKNIKMAVIVLTGHAEVRESVRAMKAGAIDFIEKPFDESSLLSAVEEGLKFLSTDISENESLKSKIDSLTAREKQVLSGLMEGLGNSAIADKIGLSRRTVELHRNTLMLKIGASRQCEAVRVAMMAGFIPT